MKKLKLLSLSLTLALALEPLCFAARNSNEGSSPDAASAAHEHCGCPSYNLRLSPGELENLLNRNCNPASLALSAPDVLHPIVAPNLYTDKDVIIAEVTTLLQLRRAFFCDFFYDFMNQMALLARIAQRPNRLVDSSTVEARMRDQSFYQQIDGCYRTLARAAMEEFFHKQPANNSISGTEFSKFVFKSLHDNNVKCLYVRLTKVFGADSCATKDFVVVPINCIREGRIIWKAISLDGMLQMDLSNPNSVNENNRAKSFYDYLNEEAKSLNGGSGYAEFFTYPDESDTTPLSNMRPAFRINL